VLIRLGSAALIIEPRALLFLQPSRRIAVEPEEERLAPLGRSL
jgi:hypothetical protein